MVAAWQVNAVELVQSPKSGSVQVAADKKDSKHDEAINNEFKSLMRCPFSLGNFTIGTLIDSFKCIAQTNSKAI